MQEIQKYPTVTSLQIQQSDPGLEKEKKSIYSHPLYPLLSLLLEQCDQATSSPDSQAPDTFEVDLQSYVQRHEGHDNLFFTENRDLDSLIVKAIHVLRIHLNELRKVNELCRDFCTRYINCLKTKIHQDSMFDDSEDSSPTNSERASPVIMPCSGSAYGRPYSLHGREYLDMTPHHRQLAGHLHTMETHCNSGMNGITVDCADYPNGTISSSPQSGLPSREDLANNNYLTSSHSGGYGNMLDSSKQKRGVLPKKATQIMKQWLFQHLVHPYPTEDEKRQIANQTNLTLLQVNNWFINARRRILQPMLETNGSPGKEKSGLGHMKLEKSDSISEPEDSVSGLMYTSSCGNRKKKAATNRPSNNRFWPASLATAVSVFSPHPPATPYPASSPNIVPPSEKVIHKEISRAESSEEAHPHKRAKTNHSEVDLYQPPKGFSSKEAYEPYPGEVDFKPRDSSTPQYADLSSPKCGSIDGGERMKPEPTIPPKASPDSKRCNQPSLNDALFPATLYNPYIGYNPYNSFSGPHPNPYLSHNSLFYSSKQNEPNLVPPSIFQIRNPDCPTSSVYESMYPASHINDLFSGGHNGLPRPWDEPKSVDHTPSLLMTSLGDPWPLASHSYPHLDTFPNFKGFHSKTNTN